jgi:hypothetical protein
MFEPPKRASRSPEARPSGSLSSLGRSRFPPGELQSEPIVGRPLLPKEVGLSGLTGKEASDGCKVKLGGFEEVRHEEPLAGDVPKRPTAAGTEEPPVKPASVVAGSEEVQPEKPLAGILPKIPTAAGTEELPVKPASIVGGFEEVRPEEPLIGDFPKSPTAAGMEELPDEEFPEDVANEEVVHLVTVGFPDRVSKAKASFVSATNIEGFSMITKVELLSHFLPPGWEGVIKLKPVNGYHDTVALSPSIDPDGNRLMWSLGVGDYIMEAIPKKPVPTSRGCSGQRGSVLATPAANKGLGGQGTRSFHSAASSFKSASAARLGGLLPFSALSSGRGIRPRPALSIPARGGPQARPSTSSLSVGGTMSGGRPPLLAPSSGVTNMLNPVGLVGGRGGAQMRPSASSFSLGGTMGGRRAPTAAKGNLQEGLTKVRVEDPRSRELGRGGGLKGLSPSTLEKSTFSTRVEFQWGESWMEGKSGEEDEGSEVSSGITKRTDRKKGPKEGRGGKDEWAKGMFGKGRAGEGEGKGGGKVTGIKEMDDWAKGLFGKDEGLGRVRKEITKEGMASMKGAWDEEVENQRGREVGKGKQSDRRCVAEFRS